MILTTTSTLEGKGPLEYLGVVTGEVIVGANIFKDLFASVRDIVGGRSGSYESTLKDARQTAMQELIAATLVAMLAISAIGYMILPRGAQVPMQWDSRGQPTWKAPKLVAVLFSPVIALLVLTTVSLASASNPEAAGSIVPLISAVFLVVHVLHLALAQWHFNANKS